MREGTLIYAIDKFYVPSCKTDMIFFISSKNWIFVAYFMIFLLYFSIRSIIGGLNVLLRTNYLEGYFLGAFHSIICIAYLYNTQQMQRNMRELTKPIRQVGDCCATQIILLTTANQEIKNTTTGRNNNTSSKKSVT